MRALELRIERCASSPPSDVGIEHLVDTIAGCGSSHTARIPMRLRFGNEHATIGGADRGRGVQLLRSTLRRSSAPSVVVSSLVEVALAYWCRIGG